MFTLNGNKIYTQNVSFCNTLVDISKALYLLTNSELFKAHFSMIFCFIVLEHRTWAKYGVLSSDIMTLTLASESGSACEHWKISLSVKRYIHLFLCHSCCFCSTCKLLARLSKRVMSVSSLYSLWVGRKKMLQFHQNIACACYTSLQLLTTHYEYLYQIWGYLFGLVSKYYEPKPRWEGGVKFYM